MTADLATLNLYDLKTHYRDREITEAVQRMVRSERFRREYTAEAPVGRSIDERALDEMLMRYYSLVEVAAIARYVPATIPDDARRSAIRDIALIEDTSRYPLVKLHLLRLLRHHESTVQDASETADIYAAFLDLNRLVADPSIEAFAAIVEQSRHDDLQRLESILRDQQSFVSEMSVPPAEQQELHLALHGCIAFLAVVRGLDGLLRQTESPLLRSAFWHHHARWFDRRRTPFATALKNCIHQMSTWPSPAGRENEDEAAGAIAEVEAAVDRIIWSNDDAPVDEIFLRIRSGTPAE